MNTYTGRTITTQRGGMVNDAYARCSAIKTGDGAYVVLEFNTRNNECAISHFSIRLTAFEAQTLIGELQTAQKFAESR